MKLKKIVAFVAMLAIGGWYYATPYLAIAEMRRAAQDGDATGFAARVDFPAVRASLKADLQARIGGELAPELRDNPFAALGAALAGSMAGVLVDALVTPEGVAMLLRGVMPEAGERPEAGEGREPVPGQARSPRAADEDRREPAIVERGYTGWNRFEFVVAAAETPDDTVRFIMRRHGLADWKLSAIDLSER
ncbi:MAG: DUF2939 domain-containing protein [Thauera phenolivorans]|uniref:DUF2939 domain-containing protein n=1 Tax=Thauera phenolivorans TaxID=1792543 RepID=A0A7X7LTN7_9RHOO|nr:DUF2939 domain-containing protein [Thauera phenolivorans]